MIFFSFEGAQTAAGCGSGWILTGSDIREKPPDLGRTFQRKKARIRIRPSKTTRIRILPYFKPRIRPKQPDPDPPPCQKGNKNCPKFGVHFAKSSLKAQLIIGTVRRCSPCWTARLLYKNDPSGNLVRKKRLNTAFLA